MQLSELATGTPPCVSGELLAHWEKLSDDLVAAFELDGEEKMSMIKSLLPEWRTAVEDVNTAHQVCVALAEQGRRDEALNWHANGFYEIAKRLNPDRPGWGPVASSLQLDGITAPSYDEFLREAFESIEEDLQTRNLEGHSLTELLEKLRRNMLTKGGESERIILLGALKELDPTGEIWNDMISPLRRKRGAALGNELKQAIEDGDFVRIGRIRREVESQQWENDLEGSISSMMNAALKWETLHDLHRSLSKQADDINGYVLQLKQHPAGSNAYYSSFKTAKDACEKFKHGRRQVNLALKSAKSSPEVAVQVEASGIEQKLSATESIVSQHLPWLGQQERFIQFKDKFHALEMEIQSLIARAPTQSGEQAKVQGNWWRDKSFGYEAKIRDLSANAGVPAPESLSSALEQLKATRLIVEQKIKRARSFEVLIVCAALGVAALFILILILLIVFSR